MDKIVGKKNKKPKNLPLRKPSEPRPRLTVGVASAFNEYFSGIAASMKNEISTRMPFDRENSIFLPSTNQFEVHKVINDFKNKSTLDTKAEASKLANTSFTFTNTLAKIISSSFQQGIFRQTQN